MILTPYKIYKVHQVADNNRTFRATMIDCTLGEVIGLCSQSVLVDVLVDADFYIIKKGVKNPIKGIEWNCGDIYLGQYYIDKHVLTLDYFKDTKITEKLKYSVFNDYFGGYAIVRVTHNIGEHQYGINIFTGEQYTNVRDTTIPVSNYGSLIHWIDNLGLPGQRIIKSEELRIQQFKLNEMYLKSCA